MAIYWLPKGVSVNSDNYLDLLKNNLMTELQSEELEDFFFQQDGAPPHCAARCLEFLEKFFCDRVISRRTFQPWPASCPDLSPLYFWFWAEMDSIIQEKQPDSIESLKQIASEGAVQMGFEKIILLCDNFRRRVEKCRENEGGHLEAEM